MAQVKLHGKGGGKPVMHRRDKVKGYRDYRDYPVKLPHEAVFANLAGNGHRVPPLGDKVARYKWYQQQAPYHIPPPPAGTNIHRCTLSAVL